MSIGISQAAFNRYTTNSATFSITFPRHAENEVKVYAELLSDGTITEMTLDTDYSLSNILPASGNATVTLIDAGQAWIDGSSLLDNSTYAIVIEYNTAGKQETSFSNLGRFAPVSFEKVLDQLTMTLKAQARVLARTIQFRRKDITDGYDPVLPDSIVGNGDKVIAVNDAENGLKFGPTTASISANATAAAASAVAAAASEAAAAASESAAAASESAAAASEANAAASEAAAAASASATYFTIDANQDIGSGGQITQNGEARQWLKVSGNGGAQTASNTPFATNPTDGTMIVLEGQSGSNTLTIPYADVAGGCLLNGDRTLRLNSTLTLVYDATANRYKEMAWRA